MAKALQFIVCLALILPAGLALAADDDINSSVYLVFDPETGEFVTVEDQDGTQRQHEALGISDAAGADSPPNAQTGGQVLSPAAAGAIAIVVFGAAIILAQRKSRKPS
jgi:hypothetical protein